MTNSTEKKSCKIRLILIGMGLSFTVIVIICLMTDILNPATRANGNLIINSAVVLINLILLSRTKSLGHLIILILCLIRIIN